TGLDAGLHLQPAGTHLRLVVVAVRAPPVPPPWPSVPAFTFVFTRMVHSPLGSKFAGGAAVTRRASPRLAGVSGGLPCRHASIPRLTANRGFPRIGTRGRNFFSRVVRIAACGVAG